MPPRSSAAIRACQEGRSEAPSSLLTSPLNPAHPGLMLPWDLVFYQEQLVAVCAISFLSDFWKVDLILFFMFEEWASKATLTVIKRNFCSSEWSQLCPQVLNQFPNQSPWPLSGVLYCLGCTGLWLQGHPGGGGCGNAVALLLRLSSAPGIDQLVPRSLQLPICSILSCLSMSKESFSLSTAPRRPTLALATQFFFSPSVLSWQRWCRYRKLVIEGTG